MGTRPSACIPYRGHHCARGVRLPDHKLFPVWRNEDDLVGDQQEIAKKSLLADFCCVTVGVLLYWPIADAQEVRGISYSTENMRHRQSNMIWIESFSSDFCRFVSDDDDDPINAGQSPWEGGVTTTSIGIDSDSSTKGGSISFREMLKNVPSEPLEEVNLFVDAYRMLASPPGFSPLLGKPVIPYPEGIL